jgi:hypothetical protein
MTALEGFYKTPEEGTKEKSNVTGSLLLTVHKFRIIDQARFMREAGEFGHGLHLQLGHEIGPVRLDGSLGGGEIVGNLFIQLTLQHMREHFVLARRERLEAGTQFLPAITQFAFSRVARQRALNRRKQHRFSDGFGEKVVGAGAHRAD